MNQVISRNGHGVSPSALLDAVRNPTKAIKQNGGRMRYVGKHATVILNDAGKVITAWPKNRNSWRY